MDPRRLISAPFEVYIAPVGESFPAIDTTPPGGNWTLIGTSGSEDYTDDGVTVQLQETIEDFRGLGNTGVVKSFRTEEGVLVNFMVVDHTLEEVARALNQNSVQTSSDDKFVDLHKGFDIATRALLVRGIGKSPYGDGNIQWQIPRVRQAGTPEITYTKGAPAGIALSFMALVDLNAAGDADKFGEIRTQYQNF